VLIAVIRNCPELAPIWVADESPRQPRRASSASVLRMHPPSSIKYVECISDEPGTRKGHLKTWTVSSAAVVALLAQGLMAQHLVLTNPLDVARPREVVEVPLKQVLDHLHLSEAQAPAIVAVDAITGVEIPDQLYSSKPGAVPDLLLLLIQLPANGSERIAFHLRENDSKTKALVFGREAPERKDDFAWENDLVTYRIYGPALQATGEIASGIDVWSKRVPNFVIDSFYKRDLEGVRTHNPAMSYHKDNGVGLDSYFVGPTRGCGGTGVFADGRLFVSKNYTAMHILANGPIRLAFEVSYAPWDANGVSVTETKQIVLDAGTHLNKIQSTYTFEGQNTLNLVAGIAVHEGASAEFPVKDEAASVWDTPQDPTAGRIETGLIAEPGQHASTVDAAGHALLMFSRHSGEPFRYFAGAGWSKADMPSIADWNAYLKLELELMQHPVTSRWAGK